MEVPIDRAIVSSNDGSVSAFRLRRRFTRLAAKAGVVKDAIVYCPDGSVRQLLSHEDIRMELRLSDLLYWNPVYNATPILSESIGTYEFRELKLLVAKHIRRVRHSIAGGGPELKAQLERATTFDDLLDIVSRVDSP